MLILVKDRFVDPSPEPHTLLNPVKILFTDYRGMLASGFDNIQRMTDLVLISCPVSALGLYVLAVMMAIPHELTDIELVLQDVTDKL